MLHSSRTNWKLAVAAAVAFGLGLPTEAVLATTLFDNTSALGATVTAPGSSASLATAPRGVTFTVGANAITLNQATFGMYGNAVGNAGVGLRLYAGSNASGTALQTVSAFSVALTTIANGGTLVTFNTSGWSLTAGATYTLAAYNDYAVVGGSTAPGVVTPRLGTSTVSSGSWTSNGLTFSRFTAGTGAASDNYYVALSGTIASGVPGAGFASLATLGLAGASRRRRR
jgi:hypothetical protein